jgi:geranylgeranyl reductase family protein
MSRFNGGFRSGFDAEVIVVGGGPGGSATATLLAEAGHRVLLLDKARFPRHKACSEFINPAAVQILHDLGMDDAIAAAHPHRTEGMVIYAPDGRRFLVDFPGAQPGQTALGLSRYRLDHLLLQRAVQAGVSVQQGAHVRNVICQDGCVTGVEATIDGVRESIRALIVIGADGRHSTVSRCLGLDAPVRWPQRTGLIAHYRGVTGLDRWGELHVVRGAYAGLASLEDGLTNVAYVASMHAVAQRSASLETFFEQGLNHIPQLASKLAGAERIGSIRGMGPMAHRARQVAGDGFLLVGDAASFLDPFTGEGIYEALRAAQLAAPVVAAALRAGDTSAEALAPYRARRRRAFTAKRQVCWIVQGFIHAPPLMNYVTNRLDQRDGLRQTLSGVMGDFRPAGTALSPLFLARLLRP